MVKVGEKCKGCKYYSHRTETCDYRLLTGKSRHVTNGMRHPPELCDKYVKGEKIYDGHEWNERGIYR